MKWKEARNGAQGGSAGEATLENHCETPFCSWLERAPGENLTAISRAFVPPWSLIEDETGQLSDQTLQRSRNPSSPEDSVRKSPRLSAYCRLQKACHSVRALQSHDTTMDCGSLSGIRARARQPQNRAER